MSQYPQGYSAYYAYNQSSAQQQQPPPPPPPPPRPRSTSQAPQYDPYQQPAAEPLRRTPSYVPGDDATPIETRRYFAADGSSYPAQGHTTTSAVYEHRTSTTDSSLGSHRSQLSTAGSQHSNPSRSSSRGSSNYSSYHHSYSPQAPVSTQPGQPAYNPQAYNTQTYNPQTYNPQQYSRPHSYSLPGTSYNPQAFSSLNTSSQYSPPAQQYQPYNPAVYQSTNSTNYAINTQRPSISVPPRYTQYSTPAPGSDHTYGARPSHEPSPNPPYPYSPTSPVTQHSTTGYFSGPTSPTYSSTPSFSSTSPQPYAPYRASQPSVYSSVDTLVTQDIPPATMPDLPPAPPAHQSFGDAPYGRRPSESDTAVTASMSPSSYASGAVSSPRRTNTFDRHPQARPLPGPPPDAEEQDLPSGNGDIYDLMNQVEAAIPERPLTAAERSSSRLSQSNPHTPDVAPPDPLLTEGNQAIRLSPDERHTHTNGNVPTGTGQYINYDAYTDESDAEAEAGLAMMREAEEEERAEAERLQSGGGPRSSRFAPHGTSSAAPSSSTPPREDSDSESDFPRYDIALYEGGYQGNLHYGEEELRAVAESRSRRTSDVERSENREDQAQSSDDGNFYLPDEASIHPFPYPSNARVDTGGTGGLSEPGPVNNHRMSFDDGEGEDEGALAGRGSEAHSESESPLHGEFPDLFFHPGMRPLPPPPVAPAAGASPTRRSEDQDTSGQSRPLPQPTPSDSYGFTVPRSTSLSDHSNTPRTDPPIRSKTDADRARHRQQAQQQLPHRPASMFAYNAQPLQPSALTLDLPALPASRRKKFNPAKLSSEQFHKCSEPWALSAIVAWIKDLAEEETDLKEQAIIDAIVALFTHKVPTMNIADAETLADRVVKNMLEEGALVKEEEWVKFGQGTLSGVLFQITGSGCYSSRVHEQETENFDRCYSHHCMRTLKKINLKAEMMEPQKKTEDWVTFYKVPREVWEAHPRKEIDRQNNLHEIVTTEDAYIAQLDLLRELYRDQLATIQPPVINPKRLDKFLTDVFGKVDAVKKVNEDYLLAQMKYRQKEQGPFIVGFSDIFREWIRRAKTAYIEYAATFPHANYLVRREAERNPMFQQFLDQARDNPKSNRLSWDTYLKAPITRIQRYTLLLSTVHKNMVKESEEKTNLAQAIEEIKVVAMECDNKVGEMTKKVDLMELSSKLQLRPEMKKVVELNLEHLGRQVIFRGDLQRPGTRTRFNLVDTHAILFDHYLVLAKAVQSRDPRNGRQEIYDVSKLPIPMDLLVLESTNDDPVVKSAVRGISTVTPAAAVAARGSGTGTNTNANATFASSDGSRDDKILFPFKVKHLGKTGTYTLYSTSLQNRQEWCEKIIEAKSKHAASLFAQNAEPFRLRVLADVSFAYSESPGPKPVTIKGTPLDRAIQEVEARYANVPKPNVVCRASVNCATVFQQPSGQLMCAIGTDAGVFISPYDNPRGWVRAIPARNVTQITVFEDFNLLLVIADRSLIAYHLDVVCPANGVPTQTSQHDSARRAPQKLSGNREVGFFAVGRMKERILVFYKKRDGISSTFKVLEPVLQRSTTIRSRFLSRRGQTEFFRDYDEFYIPTESYNINLFHSSLAIATQRGIEVMTLDKKQPWSVPFLRSENPEAQSYLTSIGNRIKDLRPLGMFRLSDSEFIIAYSECAVYVNKHGDVSRSVIMEFVGQAQTACLYGRFLILFNEDFVEVRNAMNGRLRQVIPGRNVVCLDHGGNPIGNASSPMNGSNFSPTGVNGHFSSTNEASRGRTVKFCMQHPKYERSQLVVELIENEGQKD